VVDGEAVVGVRCLAVADERVLRECWEDVLAADREDGELGAGVSRFREDAAQRLEALAGQLREGTWRPDLLTRVEMARDDGRIRLLHVPSVRDRVVERAVLGRVSAMVDPLLSSAAFAYRPGLGVRDAVQEVTRLREEGFGWVARTDIDECFPSIPVDRLRRRFDLPPRSWRPQL